MDLPVTEDMLEGIIAGVPMYVYLDDSTERVASMSIEMKQKM